MRHTHDQEHVTWLSPHQSASFTNHQLIGYTDHRSLCLFIFFSVRDPTTTPPHPQIRDVIFSNQNAQSYFTAANGISWINVQWGKITPKYRVAAADDFLANQQIMGG
jgi:hypothetical protein